MGNFITATTQRLLQFAEKQTNAVVASSWLPLLCALLFIALGEASLVTLFVVAALKLTNEYHQMTASHPTTISRVFRSTITVMLGYGAWTLPLPAFVSLFLLMLSVVIAMWILALSNLHPFTEQQLDTDQALKNKASFPQNKALRNTNFRHAATTPTVDSSFDCSFASTSSALNDSFHYSPNTQRLRSVQRRAPQPLHSNSNILNTSGIPFEMDHNETLICDYLPAESKDNGPASDSKGISSIAEQAEPTNFFQAVVGFSSVQCARSALGLFEGAEAVPVDKAQCFRLSPLHFAAMLADIFSFWLIPFLLSHVLLFYRSQHSMIPVGYVLAILAVNGCGESMATAVLPQHQRKNVLSHSISDYHSVEGSLIAVAASSVAALALFWALGLAVFGPMCGAMRSALKMNPSLRAQCVTPQCLFCEGSFVAMRWTDHLMLGALLAIQHVVGSLLVAVVIKAFSFKLQEATQGLLVNNSGAMVLWLHKCSSFLFAFAVAFYYLM